MSKPFLDKHKVVRRAVVLWAVSLITWTTYVLFTDLQAVTGAVAAAYATCVGMLATAIGLYKWTRKSEDESK